METIEKRNTKRVGDISEIAVLAALVRAGYYVSVPFGENQRYDLVAEKDNALHRIQVKTGRVRNGAVLFNCFSSHTHRGGAACRRYTGEIEYFGVYCPDNDAVYLIPIAEIDVQRGMLRLKAARNGQVKRIRWAQRYLLKEGRGASSLWSMAPERTEPPS